MTYCRKSISALLFLVFEKMKGKAKNKMRRAMRGQVDV
jgi:hypothetical protein